MYNVQAAIFQSLGDSRTLLYLLDLFVASEYCAGFALRNPVPSGSRRRCGGDADGSGAVGGESPSYHIAEAPEGI